MTTPSASPTSSSESASHFIRWRGRTEGPLSLEEIERRLANHEIGMLHEIQHDGSWTALREFFEQREAQALAERLRREQVERRAREEADRAARAGEERQRAELLSEERRKNDLLEAAVRSQQASPDGNAPTGGLSGLQITGLVLLIVGAGVAIYFFAVFDQSVASGVGERIVNLGLMQDRQAGILVGLGMAAVGALLLLFGKRSLRN